MRKDELIKKMAEEKKAIPILFYPASQIIDTKVIDLVTNPFIQAKAMKAINDNFDVGAIIGIMDLSVEAEAFGANIKFLENEVPSVSDKLLLNIDDVKNLTIPELEKNRASLFIKACRKASFLIKDKPLIAGCIGPFSLASRLLGLTEAIYNCYDEPKLLHCLLEKISSFLINYILAFKKAGAFGILMAEPTASLLSPLFCSEFSSDYVKKICNEVKSNDFIFIYHNCGNILPLLDSIIEINADIYHFGEENKLAQILQLFPSNKLVLGNISSYHQFLKGTNKSIYEATKTLQQECLPYKNFILSSSCDIPALTPLSNIEAFFKAIND